METLEQESLEVIEQDFIDKSNILSSLLDEVSSTTLYEDIFDDVDTVMPIVILDEEEQKHILQMPISEAVAQSRTRNDMLLGGSTYFHNWISKASAKDIRAFIIDMDNVWSGQLAQYFKQDWKTTTGRYIPKPTYIVNSGTGLHLYFVFDEPIPHYKCNAEMIDKIYRELAIQETTNRNFIKRQVQWFGQDFRIAGGLNKYGWTNQIFRYGDKWNIDELAKDVGLKDIHIVRYEEPRQPKKKNIDKRKETRAVRKGWKSNAHFYEYTLKNCMEKTKEGNRYNSMCGLACVAWKCNIPKAQLESDLKSLLEPYNRKANTKVKPSEIQSAIKMYNELAMQTPRSVIENWQGWTFTGQRRNHRKRADHLKLARYVRDELNGHKDTWREGNGRKSQQETVRNWRIENPAGTKYLCIKETGLSKPTVYKWWNEVTKKP